MASIRHAFSLIFGGVLILIVAFTIIVFARGYRIDLETKSLTSQGILVANSSPTSSQVYINNKFSNLTSTNIYLNPGEYDVVIKKEGYSEWKKHFSVRGEVVSRTDAQLFSTHPSLAPLTNNGVINPILSPSKEKIVYLIEPEQNALSTEETGGIFISKVSPKPLAMFRQQTQLLTFEQLPVEISLAKTRFIFSPDEKNILTFFYNKEDVLLSVLLLTSSGKNENFFDVTLSYNEFIQKWQLKFDELQEKTIETFNKKIATVLKEKTHIIELSPDKTKILYLATSSATLNRAIKPPLIGSVPTQETRDIEAGSIYVYDSKEDKNFAINLYTGEEKTALLAKLRKTNQTTAPEETLINKRGLFSSLSWYNDSRHLIFVHQDTISVLEYDGTNMIAIYSGPFEKTFTSFSSEGQLIILTKINVKTNKLPDLYAVSIK